MMRPNVQSIAIKYGHALLPQHMAFDWKKTQGNEMSQWIQELLLKFVKALWTPRANLPSI